MDGVTSNTRILSDHKSVRAIPIICRLKEFIESLISLDAIDASSLSLQGCSSPLVVKFADTQKEKEAKKMQSLNQNLWNLSSTGVTGINPQYLAVSIERPFHTQFIHILEWLNLADCSTVF